MPSRRLLAVLAFCACAFLSVAPTGGAAPAPSHWCGTDEATGDRLPDAVSSYQLHAVYAIPSDGVDRYLQLAPAIARDLAAIDTWWQGQDPTRTLRWDMHAFPGCDSAFGALDISFLRLPLAASAYALPEEGGYANLVRGLQGTFTDRYKKYQVFYDGPIDPNSEVCGVSSLGPTDAGASYAFTLVQADALNGYCGSLGDTNYMAETEVHELIHNLGAVTPSAPHLCSGGHVCDSEADIMAPYGTSDSLSDYVLDLNRDDYYGHSGSWWDVQDSGWLRHLDAPQLALTVVRSGDGTVRSDLPGIACPPACSITWDGGTKVSLSAQSGANARFAGWSGSCTGTSSCEVTMDAAKTVTAKFVPATTRVAVSIAGRGRVTSTPAGISCPGKCAATFPSTATVRLKATATKGWRFTGWSGACHGKTACALRAGAARATFKRA